MKRLKLLSVAMLFASAFGIAIYATGQPVVSQQGIVLADTTPGLHGPTGGITTLPLGETILTDTLYIDGQFGPVLTSKGGKYGSWIRWKGLPNADGTLKPIIVIRNCTSAEICNFRIIFDTPCSDAIVIANLPNLKPGTPITTRCKVHDLLIDAGTNGNKWMKHGVKVDSSYFGGPDQNNEYHEIINCDFANFSVAAVGIYSSQAHRCLIKNCHMLQSGIPQTGTGVYARFGSQDMVGCRGANLELVFYGVDQFAGVGTVIGNNFEGCKRFVHVGTGGNIWVIENNRCDGMAPHDCTDGDYNRAAVNGEASGYLSFKNNFMSSSTNIPLRLMFQRNSGLNFIGNTFNCGAAGASPRVLPIYTTAGVTFADFQWFGNKWQGAPGVWTTIIKP